MSFPGPSNVSICPVKVFTARFDNVSYGNATITSRAAIRRPLENMEVYNYPHRQTENLHDTKASREPGTLRSVQSSSEFTKNLCAMRAVKNEREVWREQEGQTLQKKKVSNRKHRPIKPVKLNSPN